jgi:hypothetical protein
LGLRTLEESGALPNPLSPPNLSERFLASSTPHLPASPLTDEELNLEFSPATTMVPFPSPPRSLSDRFEEMEEKRKLVSEIINKDSSLYLSSVSIPPIYPNLPVIVDPVPVSALPILKGCLHLQHSSVPVSMLVDSGAASLFISQALVTRLNIKTFKKTCPLTVLVGDGREVSSGSLTHHTEPITFSIDGNQFTMSFNVLGIKHDLILGMPWLQDSHHPIDWSSFKFPPQDPQPDIRMVSIKNFKKLAKDHTVYEYYNTDVVHKVCEFNSINLDEDTQPSLVRIPTEYQEFADVFSETKANQVPEHRPEFDMPIELKPDCKPHFGPIYGMATSETIALKNYIAENLKKGFIRASKSPAGSPVLFVKKKDGSLRMCVDYRKLNDITVKNRYPLPLISSILDRFRKSVIFSKFDLRGAYNLLRIREGDEWLSAFRSEFGHFEYLVVPFGLANAPAVFQNMMNDIFRTAIDNFVVVYLDDILVFSKNQADHPDHVKFVLKKLRENKLYVKLEKCIFSATSIEFLGFMISPEGVSMAPSKTGDIHSWPAPRDLGDVQCFLGFANFYRKFIKNFAGVASSLTDLSKKGTVFKWSSSHQKAFEFLKHSFTTAPILRHFDPDLPIVVEADASDFGQGAVCSQIHQNGDLLPIAFWSKKFSQTELNYEIYDKELLSIRNAFKTWRAYLLGSTFQIQVITDHRNLIYFMTTKVLNQRQVRWSQFFADYWFTISYRPGPQQVLSDALSRRNDFHLTDGEKTDNRLVQILKPPTPFISQPSLVVNTISISSPLLDIPFLSQVKSALALDPYFNEISTKLQSKLPIPRQLAIQDSLLLWNTQIYIPRSLRMFILQSRHDSPLSGHYGRRKTKELITRDFWWPKMDAFIEDYINSCETCTRSKASNHAPFGLLKPLEIPKRPWDSVSIDFVSALPLINGFDCICVIVDRFSKMAHYIPCTTSESAETSASLFFDNIVKLHGLPSSIISDRGPQFASLFWKRLFSLCGTLIKLSTAFHPETDGQTERVNQVMEGYLRCFIDVDQETWPSLLPLAEFTYNNTLNVSTQQTPFFTNFGYHPRLDFLVPTSSLVPVAESRIEEIHANHNLLKQSLAHAQATYKYQADKNRLPAPEYTVGQLVWLDRRNIDSKRVCAKLDSKKLGPYSVTEKISSHAYRLALPPGYRHHNVFHVNLMQPFYESTELDRPIQQRLPDFYGNNEPEYEIDGILDVFKSGRSFEYLVSWVGLPSSTNVWIKLKDLTHAQDIIKDFHIMNPGKPFPPRFSKLFF